MLRDEIFGHIKISACDSRFNSVFSNQFLSVQLPMHSLAQRRFSGKCIYSFYRCSGFLYRWEFARDEFNDNWYGSGYYNSYSEARSDLLSEGEIMFYASVWRQIGPDQYKLIGKNEIRDYNQEVRFFLKILIPELIEDIVCGLPRFRHWALFTTAKFLH